MDDNYKSDSEIVLEPFNLPTDSPKIIKVIGVGGGGCNAVNHMYNEGIEDVAFLVCNTDSKALADSPVPNKLQFGVGLGAGNNPEKGREEAEKCTDDIKRCLSDGTKMVFITAGMGGGTGTGAAPVVARIAKEMGILTVAIVTIPFEWEADKKIDQALDGVEAIQKHVDSLIVIKNDKLSEVYNNLGFEEAYDRADDIVLDAAKSIADIITMHGKVNLDFNDVNTMLKNGGVAIMGTGYGSGESRVSKAIQNAQTSPLLNDNDIYNAKKVLICITYSAESKLQMSEMDELKEFMSHFRRDIETKHGVKRSDENLGDKVKVTLLATGFGIQSIHIREMDERLASRSQEDLEREAKEKERLEERRRLFYPKLINGSKKDLNLYKFQDSDLDNNDIINMVENIPTYFRTIANLNEIKNRSINLKEEQVNEDVAENGTKGDEEIVF